jgi:hypothetical protein
MTWTPLPLRQPISNLRLNPTFRINNREVVLHPLEIVSVAKRNLGAQVGSLAHARQQIIASLNELLMQWH